MNIVHLLIDEAPASGAWNMALDEALLIDAVERGRCHLRFYRWAEPTLSLGYFQKPEERFDDRRFAELPAVRRLSGGGAILHDDELTYSCVVPPEHPFALRPLELYDVVHGAFVTVLNARGANVAARGAEAAHGEKPFLCFIRGDERDLLCAGHKVLGSAQRRRRGAVLQHGSLLLRASRYAPEIPGLLDLSSAAIDEGVSRNVADIAGAKLGAVTLSTIPGEVRQQVEELTTKYARPDWGRGN